jgi:HD-GYP domain-containing protein (c-di-GMP phosphodiesterase class II)
VTDKNHAPDPDDVLDDADPQRRKALTQSGRKLVPQVWGLIRTLGLYDPDNETPHRAAAALSETLETVQATEDAAALIVFGDSAFLNGCRLRLDHATYRLVRRLATFLSDRGLGGICFHRGHRTEMVMEFLIELRDADRHEDPKAHMEAYLQNLEIPEVTLVNPHRHRTAAQGGEEDHAEVAKRAALEVYARAMYALSERAGSHDGAAGRFRRQTVAVRRLVVLSERDQETFLQLSALRGLGSPVLNHSLNVTILALTLGRNAGLSRAHLVRLGIAAMNHNVGEVVPREWDWDETQAGGDTDPHSDEAIAHTLRGMYLILGQHGITPRAMQRAIVAAEHHRYFDGIGGFPELPPAKPHLFSRIVGICDAYDTLVWSPVEDTRLPPDQALRRITRGTGEMYDPLLVRLFAAMVGRYPPGSLVELDNGELAIVVARGQQLEGQSRPLVLRIRDEMGLPLRPTTLDLSEKVPGKRRFVHVIVRTRDPARLGINVASYMFAEEDVAAAGRAASEVGDPTPDTSEPGVH